MAYYRRSWAEPCSFTFPPIDVTASPLWTKLRVQCPKLELFTSVLPHYCNHICPNFWVRQSSYWYIFWFKKKNCPLTPSYLHISWIHGNYLHPWHLVQWIHDWVFTISIVAPYFNCNVPPQRPASPILPVPSQYPHRIMTHQIKRDSISDSTHTHPLSCASHHSTCLSFPNSPLSWGCSSFIFPPSPLLPHPILGASLSHHAPLLYIIIHSDARGLCLLSPGP